MTAREVTRLRKRLGLSIAELADRIGVDQSTVWRWEQGVVTVSKLAATALKSLELEKDVA